MLIEQFTINTELPTLNEYIKAERGTKGKYIAAKLKKNATESVAWFVQSQSVLLPKDTLFDVVIDWYRKDKRHDSDNVFFGVKFILDGLVLSGKLENDNRKHIQNIHNNIITDRKSNANFCIVKIYKAQNPC